MICDYIQDKIKNQQQVEMGKSQIMQEFNKTLLINKWVEHGNKKSENGLIKMKTQYTKT